MRYKFSPSGIVSKSSREMTSSQPLALNPLCLVPIERRACFVAKAGARLSEAFMVEEQ